ncbi:Serine/threonine-protein kinase-like protein CCR4 [Linum perenne]
MAAPLLPFSFDTLFYFIFFLLLSISIHSCSALSTVAISETSNQTLVCAIVQPFNTNESSFLTCSHLNGTPIPINSSLPFSGVVSGDGFVCAVRTFTSSPSSVPASVLVCWRFTDPSVIVERKRIYSGPEITELESGNSHICGLIGSNSSVQNNFDCWQWPEFNSSVPNFSAISVGENFVCGLSSINGAITCRGDTNSSDSNVIRQVPRGENYRAIAAGFRHACAIRSDGRLTCWGELEWSPDGVFISVALGENRSCGLRRDDTVVCWGENGFRLPESLEGSHFITIEAKRSVFCGVVREDFSLLCWGGNINPQNSSSSIIFQRVLPSPCRIDSQCRCGALTGSGNPSLCRPGYSICQNCPINSDPLPLPPPPQSSSPPPSSTESSGGWNGRMTAFTVVGSVGSLALLLVIGFFVYKRFKCSSCRVHDSGPMDETLPSASNPGQGASQPQQRNQSLPRVLEKRLSELASMGNAGQLEEFSLEILLQSTRHFAEEHKIGTGSFGTVYRATLPDGREVAIKRAENSSSSPHSLSIFIKHQDDKDKAFVHELESLSRLHHKNLVRLLGFCEDTMERILVYEYMKNGSLHDHIHRLDDSPLATWPARIKVALDAARGIEYLHVYSVPPIIHRDIKSSNILLDDSWNAKVSDFGLSLMGPTEDESHLSMRAAGTVGYMDPEYYRLQHLTTKSDVYSFGIVMLEMLSGYKAIHKNENGVPRNVVDYVVPYIVHDEIHRVLDRRVPPPTPFEIEAVAYVGYLAADCVTLEGKDRPSMTEIVNSLERALSACLVHSLSRSTTGSSA